MQENQFSGYFWGVPENMALPIALFLSEPEAARYDQEYGAGAVVRKYQASSE